MRFGLIEYKFGMNLNDLYNVIGFVSTVRFQPVFQQYKLDKTVKFAQFEIVKSVIPYNDIWNILYHIYIISL